MLATGNIWQGLTILVFGLLVISVIDNLLRPIIVGRDIAMHPVIVLLASFGGLILFGASGFVIGPVIAALFLAVISIYNDHYSNELGKN
jgi:predicted PurR-regulated permease PerM